MELGKVLNAVKLPIIIAIVLLIINTIYGLLITPFISTIAVGGIIIVALLSIVLFVIMLAIYFWAGTLSAKATAGSFVEGAVGALIVYLVGGILGLVFSIFTIPLILKGAASSVATDVTIIFLIMQIIGFIIGAIIAVIVGAIGGYTARKK